MDDEKSESHPLSQWQFYPQRNRRFNLDQTNNWGLLNYNNDEDYLSIYGLLHNRNAVNDSRHIAPEGWHAPTDDEWKQLEMYLGLSQSEVDDTEDRGTDEDGKLKEAGISHRLSPNTGATNETGFTALPGGPREDESGSFGGVNFFAYFWSSTGYNRGGAWTRGLSLGYSRIDRGHGRKRSGFSVGYMRDN